MIIVECIRDLETKIERLLNLMTELRATNDALNNKLAKAESIADEVVNKLEKTETARRISDEKSQRAEKKLDKYQSDQQQIEATISRALHQLDEFDTGTEKSSNQESECSDSSDAITETVERKRVGSPQNSLLSNQSNLNEKPEMDDTAQQPKITPEKKPVQSVDKQADSDNGSELDIF